MAEPKKGDAPQLAPSPTLYVNNLNEKLSKDGTPPKRDILTPLQS